MEKVQEAADAVAQLQAETEAEYEGGMSPDLETMASVLKISVAVACQVLPSSWSASTSTDVGHLWPGCIALLLHGMLLAWSEGTACTSSQPLHEGLITPAAALLRSQRQHTPSHIKARAAVCLPAPTP